MILLEGEIVMTQPTEEGTEIHIELEDSFGGWINLVLLRPESMEVGLRITLEVDERKLAVVDGVTQLPLPIVSNGSMRCADCKDWVTEENDSGWEAFVTANRTQPLCKTCDRKRSTLH